MDENYIQHYDEIDKIIRKYVSIKYKYLATEREDFIQMVHMQIAIYLREHEAIDGDYEKLAWITSNGMMTNCILHQNALKRKHDKAIFSLNVPMGDDDRQIEQPDCSADGRDPLQKVIDNEQTEKVVPDFWLPAYNHMSKKEKEIFIDFISGDNKIDRIIKTNDNAFQRIKKKIKRYCDYDNYK